MTLTSAAAGRRTGLVVLLPEAEPVVGAWRAELDPAAANGMPAHITVLYPWFRARELEPDLLGELGRVTAGRPAFDLTFDRVGRFPETLWLHPNPPEPFVELTEAVRRRWPEHPPFGGRFDVVIPHLTIGDRIDPDAHGHVVDEIEQRLPVRGPVAELTLMAQDSAGRWFVHSAYPLGG
ncbi:MAG: 2'-5' RNA ligase family protein [Mycobacteriales bacterium]